MNIRLISLTALLTIVLFSACKKKEAKKEIPPQSVTITNVIEQDIPIYSEYVGQVYGLQDIPIRARVQGFLKTIDFREGFPVKKKQLLYTIDPTQYQADVATQEGVLAEARTRLTQAINELQRIEPLAKVNAVSQSDLDAAIADKGAAQASVEAARALLDLAKIELGYCQLYSPIDGVIGKTKAREGEFVGKDPNPVILNTVSRLDSIRVQFSLTESDYLSLMRKINKDKGQTYKERKKGKGSLELLLSDGSTHAFLGTLDFIDRDVNTTTGSIMLQASFPNPNGLVRPGQFAKVRGRSEIIENALLVPQKAVTELQGKHTLTVIVDGNKIDKRSVKVGPKVGDYWIITSGLKANEQVVYEGIQKVREGMTVSPNLKEFISQTDVLEKK